MVSGTGFQRGSTMEELSTYQIIETHCRSLILLYTYIYDHELATSLLT